MNSASPLPLNRSEGLPVARVKSTRTRTAEPTTALPPSEVEWSRAEGCRISRESGDD